MLLPSPCRSLLVPFLGLVAGCLTAQARPWHPAEHGDRGLPRDPLAFAPYADDVAHPANRAFRALWLQRLVPAEVAAVLPREAVEWKPGWVHAKRIGAPADVRWFGGDGRLLPLESLDADDELAALGVLAGFTADAAPLRALRARPELAVLLQHDLLRAAERLASNKHNPRLLPELVRAARVVALDAATLATLRDPLRETLAVQPAWAEQLPRELGGTAAGWREVLRRSTRLFDAEKSLLWSRVFLAHPDGPEALTAMLPAAGDGAAAAAAAANAGKGPTVPIGFRAVLVQGIVAIDTAGKPHATPLTFDVRTQVLANRDALGTNNATFTRDGLDFGIWQLTRQGVRSGDATAFFRRLEADDQDLFRDYGTSKHTTYRGQCTLCHRLSDTPEPHLAGFPVLRPHAQAAFAATGDERLRLAETQMATLWARLAAAK